MTILDRYIARQYLFNALALLVLLFCFVVMIDVALNLDRFIDAAARLSRAPGGGRDPEASVLRRGLIAAFLVADLWWPRLVQLYNYMIGMVLVGAMGFTFAQLVRHRELVAMLAGGVSLYRAARPVLVVALGFLAVAAVNQELAIPRLAEEGLLTRDHGDAGRRDWRAFEVRPMRDGQGRVLHARRFVPAQGRLEGVNIWERDETMRAVRRVSAASATWREGGWWLEGSVEELQHARSRLGPAGPTVHRTVVPGKAEIDDRDVDGVGPDRPLGLVGAPGP
ncbi:MAG TPA: LptF/LptG family permease, partial [Phycisphaerales bacterium]|nr:LptF/LptG family permease [Phycisphaerales bacterium]